MHDRNYRTKIVCIRFTQEEYDLLAGMFLQTGYRGSVSKKIRRALEPMLADEKHRLFMKAQAQMGKPPEKKSKAKSNAK